MKKLVLTLGTSLIIFQGLLASDTLSLNLTQTEARFLQKNFILLASKYNIDIAHALTNQAGLWANPDISLEQNIYNQYTEKVFDISNTGQTAFQIQQLIYLAGKRNKRVQVQKYLEEMSQYQFFDLMRSLRFELTNNFYALYFTIQKRLALEKQIKPLSDLTAAYDDQLRKGNVSMKEVARLKALLFELEAERLSFVNQEVDFRSSLNILLAIPNDSVMAPQYLESKSEWIEKKPLVELQNEALANRFDLKAAQADSKSQEANYSLQRANRVPDISIGYLYDRAGSYIYNYNAVTLNFTLPTYDRNQNYVKIAKLRMDQSKLNLAMVDLTIENEVAKSYQKLFQINNTFKTMTGALYGDLEKLQSAIIENYQKKNITLIEFVDFYESYKDNIKNYLELKLARETSIEELNFAIGKKINEQ
jgi:cobalt-zinc-cadmium efflux system outer membrane protein